MRGGTPQSKLMVHPEVAELKEAYANALLSRAIGGETYVY